MDAKRIRKRNPQIAREKNLIRRALTARDQRDQNNKSNDRQGMVSNMKKSEIVETPIAKQYFEGQRNQGKEATDQRAKQTSKNANERSEESGDDAKEYASQGEPNRKRENKNQDDKDGR